MLFIFKFKKKTKEIINNKINNLIKNNIEEKKSRNKKNNNLKAIQNPLINRFDFIENSKENNIELKTIQEYLNKEKSINRVDQFNSLFITDNRDPNNFGHKSNIKEINNKMLLNKIFNYKFLLNKPKNKTIKTNKKKSCISLTKKKLSNNIFLNYSNNNVKIKNKIKNKSSDNFYNYYSKNILNKNNIFEDKKYIINEKQVLNYYRENNYKAFYSSSRKINNGINNNDIYNVNNVFNNLEKEIKQKKLLFEIKNKNLPKIN